MARAKEIRRIREVACTLAANTLGATPLDGAVAPLIWSLTVFFETYIHKGCEGTMKNFGPKKPVKFKVIGK